MANHAFIIERETDLIEARNSIRSAWEAYRGECERNRLTGFDRGEPNPDNRDLWGTLFVNAVSLRNTLEGFLQEMEREFGPFLPPQPPQGFPLGCANCGREFFCDVCPGCGQKR
jgi:hypothetical protein